MAIINQKSIGLKNNKMFPCHRMTKVMVGESCRPKMQGRVMSYLSLGDAVGTIVGKRNKQDFMTETMIPKTRSVKNLCIVRPLLLKQTERLCWKADPLASDSYLSGYFLEYILNEVELTLSQKNASHKHILFTQRVVSNLWKGRYKH